MSIQLYFGFLLNAFNCFKMLWVSEKPLVSRIYKIVGIVIVYFWREKRYW